MKPAMAALALMTPGDLPADGLAALRWSARPVIVFAAPDDPRRAAQVARFEANAADMAERRNVVILDDGPSSPLRARFAPEGFTVVLIGLAGARSSARPRSSTRTRSTR